MSDATLQNTLDSACPCSAIGRDRLEFLWNKVQEAPEGDVVEIGCWKGGSSLMIATSAALHKFSSKVYICDTFKGVVLAGPNDNHHKDGDFGDTSQEMVDDYLSSHHLENYTLISGIFPHESEHLVTTDKIGFLHIDVDVYEGYLAILKWAQSKLVPDAIIVFDDYGLDTCQGATKAVNEYFAERQDFHLHLNFDPWAQYKP